ncbi:AbrB/MazE/SpoVT family DNA-binding domain-containing protein [Alicyclobacillus macrosporangiidus]|uniref:Looped-hinge helix DNA binding domain-containing protein, AbrB family n=1 Tax=Alicyclobacillus macrosporangiidus TaxID=392015 RepID=A0A1I7L6B2_9BACL|nr:AbrB/MazE/SpoVT family DNA-binding domain-containing protein [Alicyclobacillus macrosporangiidus]SFV05178.1 looped-hinge helix DNA binding domain-containing protein, AbrB family [Alicyclobacillus macrosporangiidus]
MMVMEARISKQGQITVPAKVRSALGVKEGDAILFYVEGDQVVVKGAPKRKLSSIIGVLPKPNRPLDMAAVREAWARRVVEEYQDQLNKE